jgi:hypothetical protein
MVERGPGQGTFRSQVLIVAPDISWRKFIRALENGGWFVRARRVEDASF